MTDERLSPTRIRTIALRRLRALGTQAFLVKDRVQGRCAVDPGAFSSIEGLTVGDEHRFVLKEENFSIEFLKPSLFQHFGALPFLRAENQDQFRALLIQSWTNLCRSLSACLKRARTFVPSTHLDRERLMLEFEIEDGRGRASFRFDPDVKYAELVELEGSLVLADPGTVTPRLELPSEVTLFDPSQLKKLIEAERENRIRRQSHHKHHSGDIVLRLSTADILPSPEATPQSARAQHMQQSGDLILRLSTNDIVPSDGADTELALPPTDETADVATTLTERTPRYRLPDGVPALLSWDNEVREVRVLDLNIGGVYVGLDLSIPFPQPGAEVLLSGVGPFAARARVVHVRNVQEGTLFATPPGIGLAYLDGAEDRAVVQEAPACLVIGKKETLGGDLLEVLFAANLLPIAVENPVAASIVSRHMQVNVVLIDARRVGTDWRSLGEALRFGPTHVRVVVSGVHPDEDAPEWASLEQEALTAALLRRHLFATPSPTTGPTHRLEAGSGEWEDPKR